MIKRRFKKDNYSRYFWSLKKYFIDNIKYNKFKF